MTLSGIKTLLKLYWCELCSKFASGWDDGMRYFLVENTSCKKYSTFLCPTETQSPFKQRSRLSSSSGKLKIVNFCFWENSQSPFWITWSKRLPQNEFWSKTTNKINGPSVQLALVPPGSRWSRETRRHTGRWVFQATGLDVQNSNRADSHSFTF